MPDAENKRVFFMRARTRSLTRWGGISVLAAVCVLGMTVTDDPVAATPSLAEAVWRADAAGEVDAFADVSFYQGEGRDIFVFAEPPKPKLPAPVIVPEPAPEPAPEPEPKPEPAATLNTAGLALRGVVADTAGGGWAIVSGADKYDVVVRRKDRVRGATVERILPDRIVLRKEKLTAELVLQSTFKRFAGETTQPAPVPSTQEEEPAPEPTEPRRRRSLGISVRSRGGDKGSGLLVTRVKRTDIDVRRGDVLHAIDGQAVDTMTRAGALVQEAKSKERITLRLSRGGRALTVEVPMVE